MRKITKAVIPAAGFGTRHLPVTKAVAKEMLSVLDRPAIDYVVEECVESGITDICIILSRGKGMVADYFDRVPELEASLEKTGKFDMLRLVNAYEGRARISYIRQPEMRGTAGAVELCRNFTAGEPFALLFPDDVMYNPGSPVTLQLVKAYEKTGASIVGVQTIPPELAVRYGVMVPVESEDRYTRISGYKEKPPINELPSTLTSLGRFVLTDDIYSYIEKTEPTLNGEYYLAISIDLMAKEKPVYAYDFEGTRYDIGSKEGFLKANIDYALRDKALRPAALEILKAALSENA